MPWVNESMNCQPIWKEFWKPVLNPAILAARRWEMSKIFLKNIGTLISGDISNPILKANAILIEDGKIKQIGQEGDFDAAGVETILDCAGTTVTPGLFDSHCHVADRNCHLFCRKYPSFKIQIQFYHFNRNNRI